MRVSSFPLLVGRKLLTSTTAPSPRSDEQAGPYGPYVNEGTADSDITIILAAMVCALICALVINWMLTCIRCYSSGTGTASSDEATIRSVKTGLRKAAIKALPIVVYTSASKPPGLATDCPICLTEFGEAEKVRVLPKCNHGFHMECIDKWLCSQSSCPMCRHSLNLLSRNKKPGGAAVAQAIESNFNVMHVDIEITDSTQAILPSTVTLEITSRGPTAVPASPLPPLSVSENQSSCDSLNNAS